MKAVFVVEPRKIKLRDLEKPSAGEGEVLIEVRRAGICGSDIHLYKGAHAFRRPPAILGHEVAGDVVAVGPGVDGFAPGDRVTVNPQQTCGRCPRCAEGLDNLCENKRVPGTPGWIGTFCQYFNAPAAFTHKLADTVDYGHGVLAEPLAVALHLFRAVGEAKGKSLAILGSGSIGLLALFLARRLGFARIVCTDTVRYNLDKALAVGADVAVNPLVDDVRAAVDGLTGGAGVDMTIITAGAADILDQAVAVTRKGGAVQLVSMMTAPVPFASYPLVFKELALSGSMQYTGQEYARALAIINGGADLAAFISHTFPAPRAGEAFEVFNGRGGGAAKVLIDFDELAKE